MQYALKAPPSINAHVKLPASKSISNRVLIIHSLSGGDRLPDNLSDCDDTRLLLKGLQSTSRLIDIGAGGTAMRFLSAYYSCQEGERVITGTERMKHRPIGPLVDALRYLGAEITYEGEEGYPPLRIIGHPLEGGHIDMPGNMSSQFVSALLMIGPTMRKGVELRLTGSISSRPYIDLTMCTMREFGADVEWTDVDTICVKPKPYESRQYLIENDWTAASYWYEILSLYNDSENTIDTGGLMDGSMQGDSVVKYIFSMLGVKTAFSLKHQGMPSKVSLTRHMRTLPRLDYDFINSPDLAQTLVTTCAALGIPFHFTGLGSLRIKETDRIDALMREMRKLGFVLRNPVDTELVWDGKRCEPTMEAIDTYEDHRMAMAFAPLAVCFPGLRINDPQVVSKSYPDFWDELEKAGFLITEY